MDEKCYMCISIYEIYGIRCKLQVLLFELYQYVNMKLLGIRCKLQVLLFERNSQSSHHVSINLYQAIILQIA